MAIRKRRLNPTKRRAGSDQRQGDVLKQGRERRLVIKKGLGLEFRENWLRPVGETWCHPLKLHVGPEIPCRHAGWSRYEPNHGEAQHHYTDRGINGV